MRKLLAADFAQLLRDKVFWAAFAFMIVSTAILVVSTHNMIALDNYAPGTWTAETSMFCMLPSVGIVNAIWLHLFIGSDYDQGTIRNKFIRGHTRRAIFFSHWLIASAGDEHFPQSQLCCLRDDRDVGTLHRCFDYRFHNH